MAYRSFDGLKQYKFLPFLIDRSLFLGKVSNHHILKTGPPNYKPSAQVLPVATSAKCSKHGHI